MNIGRYEIERELGRGGMAIVYLARDPYMKRQIALKVLPRQFTFDPQFRSRFQREAEIIAALEHPYIVPVYDYGEHEDQPYIVMRYMPGGTLARRLEMGDLPHPLPLPEIDTILQRIAAALDYAHGKGVVHRDIKPENTLFDGQGNAFLSDFGIARLAEASAAFTGTAVIGTPAYMSPEQARGEKNLDGRSDIYSLGVLLFQTLTGELPFKAETPMGLAVAHISEPAPDLLERRPDLPPGYGAVIRRTLDKDPANRFQTAGELSQAMIRAAAGETGPAFVESSTVVELPVGTVIEPEPAATPSNTQHEPVEKSAFSSIPDQESARIPSDVPPPPVAGRNAPQTRGKAWIGLVALALILCLGAGIGGGFALGFFPNPLAVANNAAPTQTFTAASPALLATETLAIPDTSGPTPEPFVPVGLNTTYIEYILDASGSMHEMLQGKSRLDIAQDVLTSRLKSLPPNTQVGLRVYGHRVPYQQEAESCADIELVVPIQPGAAQDIIDWLPTMQAQGMTPMSDSIRQAAEDFTFEPGRKNFIVLISDGEETCGDEPAEAVKYLQEIGIDFKIHVIGLGVNAQTAAQLKRIADVAGGVYHDAQSEQDLDAALGNINQIMLPPASSGIAQGAPEPAQGAPEPTQASLQPTAAFTPIPQPNALITSEGTVEASSIYDATFPTSLAVDGDLSTSWFSAGPEADGFSFYRWTGVQDDFIGSIQVISNRENQVVDFRQGYGFAGVTIQVLDANGSIVFEERHELPGTPDPDITVYPNVVGRSILLTFSGSEDPACGGIGELVVGVVR